MPTPRVCWALRPPLLPGRSPAARPAFPTSTTHNKTHSETTFLTSHRPTVTACTTEGSAARQARTHSQPGPRTCHRTCHIQPRDCFCYPTSCGWPGAQGPVRGSVEQRRWAARVSSLGRCGQNRGPRRGQTFPCGDPRPLPAPREPGLPGSEETGCGGETAGSGAEPGGAVRGDPPDAGEGRGHSRRCKPVPEPHENPPGLRRHRKMGRGGEWARVRWKVQGASGDGSGLEPLAPGDWRPPWELPAARLG